EVGARHDAEVDVAGDALEVDRPLAEPGDPEAARDGLDRDRALDRLRIHVSGHGAGVEIAADAGKADAAADRLDAGVSADLAGEAEVAGDRLDVQESEAALERRLRGRGRDRHTAPLRHAYDHVERAEAAGEELPLLADDEAIAEELDIRDV